MLFEMHSFFFFFSPLFSSPLWKYLSSSFDLEGMRFIELCWSAIAVVICSGELGPARDGAVAQQACR